jgi:hypothetical protein
LVVELCDKLEVVIDETEGLHEASVYCEGPEESGVEVEAEIVDGVEHLGHKLLVATVGLEIEAHYMLHPKRQECLSDATAHWDCKDYKLNV